MNVFRKSIAKLFPTALRMGFLALSLAAASSACLAAVTPAIKIVSGANQHTSYASSFAAPLVVQVTDGKTKQALSGVTVNFTPAAGIGVSASSVITDNNGQASVTATGTAVGNSGVGVQVSGYSAVKANFGGMIVNKAQLTVVPTGVQSVQGVIPAINDYYLKGFVNGETANTVQITGSPALTTAATASSPGGNYAIKGGVGSLAAANYSFVQGVGTLSLVPVPACGSLGADASGLLQGTYGFNLFDQQGGLSGTLTTDGVSRLEGQAFFNQSTAASPVESTFVGSYRVGVGDRGGAALVQSFEAQPGTTQITTVCFAVDNIVNGVATSGRLIAGYGTGMAEAGSFYRFDGTSASVSSFKGSYVFGLQGTKMDTRSGNPLQNVATAVLTLDGNGHLIGSLSDVDHLIADGNTPLEQYLPKGKITGSYTFDPSQGGGVISIDFEGTVNNIRYVAPSNRHLLLMTQDNAVTTSGSVTKSLAIYFGEAFQQAKGPFSTASISGHIGFLAQGVDAYHGLVHPLVQPSGQEAEMDIATRGDVSEADLVDTRTAKEGLVAEMGGYSFDGNGTMTEQGQFTLVDGLKTATEDMTGLGSSLTYTVDPVTGRFESRDPKTNACILCGYLIAPNEVYAIAPGTGIPLLATLHTSSGAPNALKLSELNGRFSTGSLNLISPLTPSFEGVITFDGKGGFQWAADGNSNPIGLKTNLHYTGTYAIVNGAYSLMFTGDSSPDFYIYMNSSTQGTIIPFSYLVTSNIPLLTLNAVNPPAIK